MNNSNTVFRWFRWLKNRRLWISAMAIYALSYVVACAPVEFERKLPSYREYRLAVSANEGKIDILIVNDNSASMSFEQRHMADRLGHLLNILDNAQVDYRIAMITTDVEDANNPPRAINQSGALQNGRLIPLGGKPFLSKENTPNAHERLNLFRQALQRPETLQCENFINQHYHQATETQYLTHCPSPDERGILAARMAIEQNYHGWLRPDAHLAIIILSDEDVRSGLYNQHSNYALSAGDQPHHLIQAIKNRYPNKHLRIHAIIVKPGDQRCKNMQDAQMNDRVRSSYGYQYREAAIATGGVVGDVCASDYADQLSAIADNITQSLWEITFACENPEPINDSTPIISFGNQGPYNYHFVRSNLIRLENGLLPNQKVYLQYKCP
ncbi:MAG: hypothetical protein NZ480_06535, partial [Bdellovibrionaceae bacterium]|nr:hypothetical protein [Pseudobdellovibrionaceae bacterium]MDW8189424.1 hypothetical protein [Pseudobdellovibrionaceae bacterium]